MRERSIKFRAWDKQCKMMIQNESEWFEKEHIGKQIIDNKIVVPAWRTDEGFVISFKEKLSKYDVEAIEIENVVLMQFTGLKDKNRKEIYEGDIVTVNGAIYGDGAIYWDEEYCRFDTPARDGLEKAFDLEIIGNIYETPNLIALN